MKTPFFKKPLPKALRKAVAPRKSFVTAAKARFLAVYDAHYPSPQGARAGTPRSVFALRILFAVVFLFATGAGAAVYADTTNVPADHPLYSLKRFTESVVLSLAAQDEKPALQATFAARRVDEITHLEEKNPSSTAIQGLTDDLRTSVSRSIKESEQEDLQDGNLASFCDEILPVLNASSSMGLFDEGDSINHLNDRCENVGHGKNRGKGGSDGQAEGGVPSSSSSTVDPSQAGKGSSKDGKDRGKGGDTENKDRGGDREDSAGVFLTSTTTSTLASSSLFRGIIGGGGHDEEDPTSNVTTTVNSTSTTSSTIIIDVHGDGGKDSSGGER